MQWDKWFLLSLKLTIWPGKLFSKNLNRLMQIHIKKLQFELT